MPHFSFLILKWENGAFQKKHVINFEKEKELKMKFFDFGAFQNKMQMPSHDKIIFHMLFVAFYINSRADMST